MITREWTVDVKTWRFKKGCDSNRLSNVIRFHLLKESVINVNNQCANNEENIEIIFSRDSTRRSCWKASNVMAAVIVRG